MSKKTTNEGLFSSVKEFSDVSSMDYKRIHKISLFNIQQKGRYSKGTC